MSKRLSDTSFLELLPDSINGDARIRAAAASLDAVQPVTVRGIPGLLLWARLYQADAAALFPPLARLAPQGLPPLSEAELDLLAWQLHVEGYEGATDYATKHRMVLESIPVHRKKGTPWAVETALGTFLSRAVDVTEWFQYSGKPYFFRIHFDVSDQGFSEAQARDIFPLIWSTKNVRSWLDYIETKTVRELPVHAGLAGVTRTDSQTRLYFFVPPPVPLPLRVAAPAVSRTADASRLYFFPPAPVPLPAGAAAVSAMHTKCCLRPYVPVPAPVALPRRAALSAAIHTHSTAGTMQTRQSRVCPPSRYQLATLAPAGA